MEPLEFSGVWLKTHYQLKGSHCMVKQVLGEDETKTMGSIKATLANDGPYDICDMGETGLGNPLQQRWQPGVKQNKSRITACVCSKADTIAKVGSR